MINTGKLCCVLLSMLMILTVLGGVPALPVAPSSPKYSLATPLSSFLPTPNLDKTITTNATGSDAIGSISVIVILVEFSNLNHTVSKDQINNLYFKELNNYYRTVSYGKLSVTGTTVGWYRLDHTLSYYGRDSSMGVDDPNNDGSIDSWWLIRDAITAADPDVNFYNYTYVVVVHAGNGQESSGTSDDIWSVAYLGGVWFRTQDSRSFNGGDIVPESEAQGASPFGVYCHEFAHLLGLPDEYGGGGKINWVGRWGLMDKGLWNGDPYGGSPAEPTSWDRIKLGWIPDDLIAWVNASMEMNVTLSALEVEANGGNYQVIEIPVSQNIYYLVEVRIHINYDIALPDEGVLIYAVDTSQASNNGLLKLLDSTPTTETLNDAAYKVGQSFVDAKNHISIVVTSESSQSYTVMVDRSGPSPDIAVEKVYFDPTIVAENETVTLKADVSNRGSQSASGYRVDLYVNDQLYHSFTVNLEVGASTTLSADWTAESGLNKIRFTLNRQSTQPDSNPGNDSLTAELVVGYSIIIGLPKNMSVKVNGTEYRPDDDGKVKLGSLKGDLILELTPLAQPSDDTRLIFNTWSDGVKDNPRRLHVDGDVSLAAVYNQQFLLSLDPSNGEASGGGWYNEGSEATVKAVTPCKITEGATRLRFSHWSGDENSTDSELKLVMDQPIRLKSEWQTQYYLAIRSPFGQVDGSGWYDQQTTVKLTADVNSAQEEKTGTRATFQGWKGDVQGASADAAITLDGPKSVEALWKIEYDVQVVSDYGNPSGSGWYLAGSDAAVKVEPMVDQSSGVRQVFKDWSGDLSSTQAEDSVKVDKPMKIQADWKTQYRIQFNTIGLPQGTKLNITLNGEDKTFSAPAAESSWFDSGTPISFNSTYRIPVRMGFYLLDHWEDETGNKITGQYTVEGPVAFSAVYKQGFGCIIATATFGSPLSPEVSFLRGFRDNQILATFAGYNFMTVFNRWYYSFSPGVADKITLNGWSKPVLSILLAPLLVVLHLSSLMFAILPSSEAAAVATGFVTSMLLGAVYLAPLILAADRLARRRLRKLGFGLKHVLTVNAFTILGGLNCIAVAEATHSYILMELGTASLVLSSIIFSALLITSFVRSHIRKLLILKQYF